jgi:mannosyltransferase PIG-V
LARSPDSPPAWVQAADLLIVLLLLLACWIATSGGGRYIVLGMVVSLAAVAPVLFAAAALALVRHVAAPRPTILARARLARTRLARMPALEAAVTLTAGTRLPVLVVGFLAVVTIGFAKPPGLVLSSDPMTNLPARFDAGWYGDLALDGYDRGANFGSQRNTAFFPALPLLMRPVGAAFGAYAAGVPRERAMARMLWAGVAISMAGFVMAVYYLVRLGSDLIGAERAVGAALLFATYPFAVFYSAPYTESLYAASAVGAVFHFRRTELPLAALWGAVAGLSRPNGCLLSVPLALLGAGQLVARLREKSTSESWRTVALRFGVAAVPGLAMLGFTAYLRSQTGVWFAWARSHEAWGRDLAGPGSIAAGYALLRDEGLARVVVLEPYDAMNTAAALFALAMLWPVFRRLGLALAVFVAINLAPAVLSGGALSVGRVTSTLFPIFLALATCLSSRGTAGWAAAFAILQGFVAVLFFTWRELF